MNWKIFVGLLFLLLTVFTMAYICLTYLNPRDLSICGLAIDTVAAITMAIPMLKTLQEIGKESTSFEGFNAYLVKSMKRDRTLTSIGLFLLAIGFLFQLVSLVRAT